MLGIINGQKFIKLETLFKLNQNIKNFTKFFYFIFNKLNCKIKKNIKNKTELYLKLSFNLTTDAGVVIYDNPFFITPDNKIINLYKKKQTK